MKFSRQEYWSRVPLPSHVIGHHQTQGLGSFQLLCLQICSLCSFLSWNSFNVKLVHLMSSQSSLKLSFFFFLFSLSDFYYSVFQLTDLFFCIILLLIPSSVFFIFIYFTLFLFHSSDLLGSSYFLLHCYSSDCLHLFFFQVPWASLWSLPWTLYPVDYLSVFCCAVTLLCPTLCHHMDCSTPGFSVLHHLPEFAQAHVHWVGEDCV